MACLNECVLYPRLMVVLAVAGQKEIKKHQPDKKKTFFFGYAAFTFDSEKP